MGDFLNGLPYTNFHELNFDWVLKMIKSLNTKVDGLEDKIITDSQLIEEKLTPEMLAEALKILAAPLSYAGPELDLIPDVVTTIPKNGVISDIYDKLVASYDALPMSKTIQGQDEDNNNLLVYRWTANSYKRTNISGDHSTAEYLRINNNMANTLILCSGIHGNERQSVYSLLNTVTWALTSEDAIAVFIRDNFNLIILPCVNPWGFINDNRYNMNGTDINRNFPEYWDTYTGAEPKGSEPLDTAGAQFLYNVLISIPANQRHSTAFLDFHDFTGANGTYAPYNFMGSASYPECKNLLLTILMWLETYMERNELSTPKSSRNIRFTDHPSSPTVEACAWAHGFSYSTLFENRLALNSAAKYSYASAKLSALQVSLAVMLYAKWLLNERVPTDIRRLADIDRSTNNTCEEISNAMPDGSSISLYVASTLNDKALGQDMPTYNSSAQTLIPGVLTINKPALSGGYITVYSFIQTYEASNPAVYLRFRVYNGIISPWYRVELST